MYVYKSFRNVDCRLISGLKSAQATDDTESGGAIVEIALKAGFGVNSPPSITYICLYVCMYVCMHICM
jgi:hypothetical protein